MLDTHARKYVQPIINKIARKVNDHHISPIQLTLVALILGLSAAIFTGLDHPFMAILLLWASGFLDALDGTLARISGTKSNRGAFLDITFDRVVEISILYAFLYRNSNHAIMLLILCSSFVLSMTVFLTVGSMAKNTSEKAFYYQAGITERTETFLFFTAMILFEDYTNLLGYIFASLVFITVAIRFTEALRLIKD